MPGKCEFIMEIPAYSARTSQTIKQINNMVPSNPYPNMVPPYLTSGYLYLRTHSLLEDWPWNLSRTTHAVNS